ncbi:glycoside hydrolase family 18 protein [Chitinibacter bivalviorum]|uniref:chitinase n=1 Tax=Chitinibacter bivalviorum TaxID=2739434 RepID=A0A7H9BHS1_9NEIS|nr:glycoside hydrolase family 18 protein [Chitinibacter bivalviorum]QLG88270.1 glycoside hydrolase family 18 protein [Chitinibacter bivalviorum]
MKKLLIPLLLASAFAHAETVVFEEDFNTDLKKWVGLGGQDNSPMYTSIEVDPLNPANKVARFNKPVNIGDIFSRQKFPAGKYKISFDYLGMCRNCGGTLGLDEGQPGRKEQWLASTANGFPNRLDDTKKWEHYEFEFKGKFDFHLKWEQWDSAKGEGKDAFIDNVKLVSLETAAPAAAAAAAVTPITAGVAGPTSPQSVMYFTAWGKGQGYYVKNLDTSGAAGKITVVEYAFGNVKDNRCVVGVDKEGVGAASDDYWNPVPKEYTLDGKEDKGDNGLYGHWNQLKQLKKKYPNLKVVISLGGWNWSKHFSDAALPANRESFVKSCVDAYIKGNVPDKNGKVVAGMAAGVFDGFDIDWEYPGSPGNDGNIVREDDTKNYTALLAEFRKQIDAIKPGYLLTVATPASANKTEKIELEKIIPSLNWINLMTYDFSGPWSGTTAPHSTLVGSAKDRVSVDSTVDEYLGRGVPSNKLVLGVPFYGYGWTVNSMENNGLYQPAIAKAKGPLEAGVAPYSYLKTLPGKVYRDDKTRAMWKVNGKDVWVYDDVELLKEKIEYAKKKKLGGIMAWEISQDTPDAELVTTIYNGMIKK